MSAIPCLVFVVVCASVAPVGGALPSSNPLARTLARGSMTYPIPRLKLLVAVFDLRLPIIHPMPKESTALESPF